LIDYDAERREEEEEKKRKERKKERTADCGVISLGKAASK